MNIAVAAIQLGTDHDRPLSIHPHIPSRQRDITLERHPTRATDDQPPTVQQGKTAGEPHRTISVDHEITVDGDGLQEGHVVRGFDAQRFEFSGLRDRDRKCLNRAASTAQEVTRSAEAITAAVTRTCAGQRDRGDCAPRNDDRGQCPRTTTTQQRHFGIAAVGVTRPAPELAKLADTTTNPTVKRNVSVSVEPQDVGSASRAIRIARDLDVAGQVSGT